MKTKVKAHKRVGKNKVSTVKTHARGHHPNQKKNHFKPKNKAASKSQGNGSALKAMAERMTANRSNSSGKRKEMHDALKGAVQKVHSAVQNAASKFH